MFILRNPIEAHTQHANIETPQTSNQQAVIEPKIIITLLSVYRIVPFSRESPGSL